MNFLFLIDRSLRLVAAIQLIYFLFLIFPKIKISANHKILALFSVAVISYLVVPFTAFYYPKLSFITYPLLIGAWSCGFLIWIMALQFFDDEFRIKPLHLIIFIVNQIASFSIAFNYPYALYEQLFVFPFVKWTLTFLFPQTFTLIFVALAIKVTLSGKEADLLEARRAFREKFVFTCTAIITFVAGAEISSEIYNLNQVPDIITSTSVMLLTFWMSHNSLNNAPWDFPEKVKVDDKSEKENEQEFSLKLNTFLSNNKFYLDQEMSVSKLADQIGCPEYKIRRYINQTLGFKNFNDFLNQHRVKEACLILGDPTKADLSIYNLGLDLGFGSPVSFNRAFKRMTELTPTEYRQKMLTKN